MSAAPPDPKRDPDARSMAFDALFYPHIIDTIFSNASRDALLALRGACKSWNNRALMLLVTKVTVKRKQRINVSSNGPGRKLPTSWFDKPRHLKELDLLGLFPPSRPLPDWVERLDHVEVLCDHTQGPGHSLPPTDVFIVNHLSSVFLHHFETPPLSLVVASSGTSLPRPHDLRLSWLPRTLTVILLPLERTSTSPQPDMNASFFGTLILFVARLLGLSARVGDLSAVTLAIDNSWYELCNDSPYLLSGQFSVPGASEPVPRESLFKRRVTTYLERVHDLPSSRVKNLVKLLDFLSVPEYRGHVGEERFIRETTMAINHPLHSVTLELEM